MIVLLFTIAISSPFSSEQVFCPQTKHYVQESFQTTNSLCFQGPTSVGNWFINLKEMLKFSFEYNVKFFLDASNWKVVPTILNNGIINPWKDTECTKHSPLTTKNTVINFYDGWLNFNSTLNLKLNSLLAKATSVRSFLELTGKLLKYPTKERLLCKFSAIFSRSKMLVDHIKKKGHEGRPYVAMHIRRITEVDSKFFDCDTKPDCYWISKDKVEVACEEWLQFAAKYSDEIPNNIEKLIFLISSDNNLKKKCIAMSNNTLLTFESPVKSHTRFGTLESSISAFADFFAMMDAQVLISGQSTFSGIVRRLKFLPRECKTILDHKNYKTICAKPIRSG